MSKTYDAVVLLGQKQQAHIPLAQSLSGKVCGTHRNGYLDLFGDLPHFQTHPNRSRYGYQLGQLGGYTTDPEISGP